MRIVVGILFIEYYLGFKFSLYLNLNLLGVSGSGSDRVRKVREPDRGQSKNHSILSEFSYLFLHMLLFKCSRLLIGTMSFLLKSNARHIEWYFSETGWTTNGVLFRITA